MSGYYTLTLTIKAGLDDSQTGFFAAAFGEEGTLSFSAKKDKGQWAFLWTFEGEPDRDDVRQRLEDAAKEAGLSFDVIEDLRIEELEERDWLAESYNALPPFDVGPFFVYGSHYTGPKPDGLIPLLIEAATAFGSGEHGTTSQCMMALAHLKDEGIEPRNIVDMGCGSGILAAAAAKLWPEAQTFAADNDPECVRVSRIHLDINGLENVPAYQSEGFEKQSRVWNDAPYDLVIANILAAPLIEMAEELSKTVASKGHVILSGMLREQADRVAGAYAEHELGVTRKFPKDEWMTLLLQRRD